MLLDRNDDPANPYGGYFPDGLYVFGPKGPICVLAILIAFGWCELSASSPDAQRKQRVVGKSQDAYRAACRWRDDFGADPDDELASYYLEVLRRAGEPITRKFAYVGKFTTQRKPATSGRKRKAA